MKERYEKSKKWAQKEIDLLIDNGKDPEEVRAAFDVYCDFLEKTDNLDVEKPVIFMLYDLLAGNVLSPIEDITG